MRTKQIGNNHVIEFTGYRSANKHRNEISDRARALGIFEESRNSSTTCSYYLEMGNDDYSIDLRFSNHSKADFLTVEKNQAVKVDVVNGHTWVEISVLSSADYKVAVEYLNNTIFANK